MFTGEFSTWACALESNIFKINQGRAFSWLTDMVNFLESALSDYNKSDNAQILKDSINSCSAELRRAGISHLDDVLFEAIKPSMSSFAHGDWECHDKI